MDNQFPDIPEDTLDKQVSETDIFKDSSLEGASSFGDTAEPDMKDSKDRGNSYGEETAFSIGGQAYSDPNQPYGQDSSSQDGAADKDNWYRQPGNNGNPNQGYSQPNSGGNFNYNGYQQPNNNGNPNPGYQQSGHNGNPNPGYQQSGYNSNPNPGYQQSGYNGNPNSGYQQPNYGGNPNGYQQSNYGRNPSQGGQAGYNGAPNPNYSNDFNSPYSGMDTSPMTMGDWLLTLLACLIPCAGLILMLIWAFGKNGNVNRRNFCRAQLIISCVIVVLYVIVFAVWGAAFAGALSIY